jgi:hypothetical protein
MKLHTHYYQQFDADLNRDVPAEGYGGWKTAELDINPERTALVIMHAWDCGTPQQFPGWYRAVEYIPRANRILQMVFPPLLAAVRSSPLKVFHVVGSGEYYKKYLGYQKAVQMAGPKTAEVEKIQGDEVLNKLWSFKQTHSFPGTHNLADIDRGFQALDFPTPVRPLADEGIAEDDRQLFALCKEAKVNHLIYTGFAINWCLLMSPGGMMDMSQRGIFCSALRQAVTAVENKESARDELAKELGLWRVALAFGFVYDVDDFLSALEKIST